MAVLLPRTAEASLRAPRLTINTILTASPTDPTHAGALVDSNGTLLSSQTAVLRVSVLDASTGAVVVDNQLMTYVSAGLWRYDVPATAFPPSFWLYVLVQQYAIDGTTLESSYDAWLQDAAQA